MIRIFQSANGVKPKDWTPRKQLQWLAGMMEESAPLNRRGRRQAKALARTTKRAKAKQ